MQVLQATFDARENDAAGDEAKLAAIKRDRERVVFKQARGEADMELVLAIVRSKRNVIHTCDSDIAIAIPYRVSCTSPPSEPYPYICPFLSP